MAKAHIWHKILSKVQEMIFAKCDMLDGVDIGDEVVIRNVNLVVGGPGYLGRRGPWRTKQKI